MSLAAFLRPVIAVACAAALAGCQFSDPLESFGGPTMGSTYSVKYVRADGVADAQTLQAGVEGILAEVDQQMSTYRDDSLIERFNRAPAGTCMAMPGAVLELVRLGEGLSLQSGGAFDLTIEPLLNLWGFGPKSRGEQVPGAEAIAEARQRVGHQHLRIDGERLCKDAKVQVDFNSVAAGHAVDRIAAWLEQQGVASYLVEATGELKARGRKPDGSAWRIAIEAPRDDQRVAQKILQLDGYGVSTSGDYRNYFEENGHRYSHTLDPRTGAPIAHRLAAVTVVHRQALLADGLSTLLMVLGPEEGEAWAERQGIAAFFVTREGDGFVSHATKAFTALSEAQGERP
ncbi:FAD:protein FMN transferase [Pseudomonas oryzae]|uniref:FAD:protein FMN transferase n=1 Tax=Pseudomonas oryzae TaxID=1392877 RepID=A0A1H1SJT8_9PSED|nr:FAD:protein FMN transferase [Pseudomonas oryzae]SDS47996.1 thiamine biosynthesis lipoprotein [Pseudomonas oryzae]